MSKYLFYHYGPGGNCDVERSSLSVNYPQIVFWDQPTTHTFAELKSACLAQLSKTFKPGEKINIIGHSFGCDLALAVLAENKIKTDHLILISPIHNLFEAFINLAQRVSHQPDLATELNNKIKIQIEKLSAQTGLENFWALVSLVVQYQNFGSIYWKSKEKFSAYQNLLSRGRPLDFVVWQTVLTDYLKNHKLQTDINFAKLKIIFGEADPYLKPSEDVQFWKNQFSTSEIEVVSCGHYPHLEGSRLLP